MFRLITQFGSIKNIYTLGIGYANEENKSDYASDDF